MDSTGPLSALAVASGGFIYNFYRI